MLFGIDASRALRPCRTGTERYAWELIYHLLALPDAHNHDWRLYVDVAPATIADLPIPIDAADFDWLHLPGRRLWTHRRLASEIRSRPPNVLFVPSHILPLMGRTRAAPTSVVTIHDLGYRHFPASHTRLQRLYLHVGTWWNVRMASRIIAVSHATAADLYRFHPQALGKTTVIHEGIRQAQINNDNAADVLARHYHAPQPYALYVGTIQPRKNIARLLHAFAKLRDTHDPGFNLLFVGATGWLSTPLYDLVKSLNIGDRVAFTGYVPDAELPALYRQARFLCFPSLFEGFGLPVLEAQNVGLPVMTSNTSSLPEIAGDAALFVDPTDVDSIANAMLRLSQDESLRHKLIAAGYENVKRFSWTEAAKVTLAVLEAAAGQSAK